MGLRCTGAVPTEGTELDRQAWFVPMLLGASRLLVYQVRTHKDLAVSLQLLDKLSTSTKLVLRYNENRLRLHERWDDTGQENHCWS
jgi:hypothetical protein